MVVKLRPQWDSKTKAADDASGWRRGARGIDGAFDADGRDFMRSADPKADRAFYGPTFGPRPNGPQYVTDRFKGAKGIDSGGDGHVDDGVTK
jgi:hypothetical protein